MMKHLFTYGAVSVEEAEDVPLKETQLGSIPNHWKIKSLSECAIVQTGVAKGRKIKSQDVVSVPYLRVANVQDGFLDLREMKHIEIRKSELDRFSLRNGDIVLTEGGDFDKLGRGFIWNGQVFPCVHQNHIFAVRANQKLVSPDYLSYMVQGSYAKSYFLTVAHKTTNLASINTTKLKALPVLIPSGNEQDQIVTCLNQVDLKIKSEEAKKQALDELFKSMLHNLMTGKVRVNNLEI